MAQDTQLPASLSITATCPFCGNKTDARYEWSSDFKCKKSYMFWKKHYFSNHSSYNEGTTEEEYYPRKCVCGEEIILKQRRVF